MNVTWNQEKWNWPLIKQNHHYNKGKEIDLQKLLKPRTGRETRIKEKEHRGSCKTF